MRIRLYKADEGRVHVFVYRTRYKERHTQSKLNVEQKDVESTIAELIAKVAPQLEPTHLPT